MKVAVQDANILIDLEVTGLLGVWFALEIETHTTSMVIEEIDLEKHPHVQTYIQTKQIAVHQVTLEERLEANSLAGEIGKLSPQDASCYQLAVKLDALLLTGDKPLRNLASTRNVPVHGTLWILDQLVAAGTLKSDAAIQKLELLMEIDTYFPKGECKKRITRWENH